MTVELQQINIKPKNSKPSGFTQIILYVFAIIGFVSIPAGVGLLIFPFCIYFLFFHYKRVLKKRPVSFILTPEEIIRIGNNKEETWRIPYKDIQELRTLYVQNGGVRSAKNLAIRLKSTTNFKNSLNKSTSNKVLRFLASAGDPMIHYQEIDRSAEKFAELLYTCMY